MKKFKVYLTAFARNHEEAPKERIVQVPIDRLNGDLGDLEEIFHFGQNDFQPVEGCYSVSMGDIIEFEGDLYMVNGFGFIKKGEQKNVDGMLKYNLTEGTIHQFHPFALEHFGYLAAKENNS